MEGKVRNLFVKPKKGGHAVGVPSVNVVAGGFEGDYHTEASNPRQILLMPGSVLDELNIAPGAVKENVVIDGVDVMALAPGQRLRIGSAVLKITVPCEPCVQMDRIRRGLQDALEDRRGMFAQVVQTGLIRVGDPVSV